MHCKPASNTQGKATDDRGKQQATKGSTGHARPAWDASQHRLRFVVVVAGVLVVAVGLFARQQRADADASALVGFVWTHLGDVLWPVAWCLAARFVWPRLRPIGLVVGVWMFTVGIECSQLWHPVWLDQLRAQPIGRLLLGSHFLWSDILCLTVDCGLAWCLDVGLRRLLASNVEST